jgi:hypothetical protein
MRRHPCRGTISHFEVYIPPLSHTDRFGSVVNTCGVSCSWWPVCTLFICTLHLRKINSAPEKSHTKMIHNVGCGSRVSWWRSRKFHCLMKQNISSEQIFPTTIEKLIQQNIFLHNFGRKNFRVENYWKNVTFSKWQKVNNILHAVPFFWPSVRVPASKWGGGSWICRSILKR